MRDPKRIDPILEKVREVWTRYPDLRLSQLIVNATGVAGPGDIFYIEDNVVERGLDEMLEAGT